MRYRKGTLRLRAWLNDTKNESRTILYTDSGPRNNAVYGTHVLWNSVRFVHKRSSYQSDPGPTRHLGRGNVLFFDGHIEVLGMYDIQPPGAGYSTHPAITSLWSGVF